LHTRSRSGRVAGCRIPDRISGRIPNRIPSRIPSRIPGRVPLQVSTTSHPYHAELYTDLEALVSTIYGILLGVAIGPLCDEVYGVALG
jgi:hypothetical protein